MRFMPDRFTPAAIAVIPGCRCKNATAHVVMRALRPAP